MKVGEAAAAPGQRSVRLSRRDLEDAERLLALLSGCGQENGGFSAAQAQPAGGRIQASGRDDRAILLARAKQIFAARRRRSQIFGKAMFGEPAWDMLLALYISEQHGSRETISTLTQFSGAPPTTALRWLDYLERQGLVRRETHPTDRRAVSVDISDKARGALDAYFAETLAAES